MDLKRKTTASIAKRTASAAKSMANAKRRLRKVNPYEGVSKEAKDYIARLESKDPKEREKCIWGLGRIGDRRTSPILVKALNDPALLVASAAARTLTLWGKGKLAQRARNRAKRREG